MAEAVKSETNTASVLLCTGNGYLWGFTVIQNGAAGLAVFDDSLVGGGTEIYRAAVPNTAGTSHTVMFPKGRHFSTGLYVTITTATVSAIWEGSAT